MRSCGDLNPTGGRRRGYLEYAGSSQATADGAITADDGHDNGGAFDPLDFVNRHRGGG